MNGIVEIIRGHLTITSVMIVFLMIFGYPLSKSDFAKGKTTKKQRIVAVFINSVVSIVNGCLSMSVLEENGGEVWIIQSK